MLLEDVFQVSYGLGNFDVQGNAQQRAVERFALLQAETRATSRLSLTQMAPVAWKAGQDGRAYDRLLADCEQLARERPKGQASLDDLVDWLKIGNGLPAIPK